MPFENVKASSMKTQVFWKYLIIYFAKSISISILNYLEIVFVQVHLTTGIFKILNTD